MTIRYHRFFPLFLFFCVDLLLLDEASSEDLLLDFELESDESDPRPEELEPSSLSEEDELESLLELLDESLLELSLLLSTFLFFLTTFLLLTAGRLLFGLKRKSLAFYDVDMMA